MLMFSVSCEGFFGGYFRVLFREHELFDTGHFYIGFAFHYLCTILTLI